jgi:hypothetical protein
MNELLHPAVVEAIEDVYAILEVKAAAGEDDHETDPELDDPSRRSPSASTSTARPSGTTSTPSAGGGRSRSSSRSPAKLAARPSLT